MRIQCSITTSDSEPEPDIAVVRGGARDYIHRHPQAEDVGLVVEVADASLSRDRVKARLYARAGVAVYWIVNLQDGQIEVHEDPTGQCDQPLYRRTAVYRPDDRVPVSYHGLGQTSLLVDDLLL